MPLKKLAVLYTNDIHSRFEQMPRIATAIRLLRAMRAGTHEVIAIDGGDHMDRAMPETEGSLGRANVEVMNATGYDAAVTGNNEGLTFSMDTLRRLYQEHARYRVVVGNMMKLSSSATPSWLSPFHILDRGGLKVGLIGLTAAFADFYRHLDWEVPDPVETARRLVPACREQADLVLLLSHLGLQTDRIMAEAVPGIDCIFGGHTHHLLERPEKVGDTWLFAAGKFGQYVGEAELHYDIGLRKLVHVSGRCLEVSRFSNDAAVAGTILEWRKRSEAELAEPVVRLSEPLHSDWDGESAFGNLMAAGLRKWCGAEIGLINSGQAMQGLDSGTVTRGQLLSACPSPVNPCRMLLTGSGILSALEQSLLPSYTRKPIFGFGFRGKVLGSLCVDGMEIEWDPSGPELGRVRRVRVNGAELEPDRIYEVGTIDMFTFGVGYMSLQEGSSCRYYLPELLRDIIRHELADEQALRQCRVLRWRSVQGA